MTLAAEQRHDSVRLPDAPALVAGPRGALMLSPQGVVESLSLEAAAARVKGGTLPLVCHRAALARRLAVPPFAAFDLLELFAFARPARFSIPTARGLAQALGLSLPEGLEAEAKSLYAAARALIEGLSEPDFTAAEHARAIAEAMASGGWLWGEAVLAALENGRGQDARSGRRNGLRVWGLVAEWPEYAPQPPAGHEAVERADARRRLAALLGEHAEPRPEQADYASAASAAFEPRDRVNRPNVVLAEAGTGVGKTLGYIAPASLWAEKNEGAVWLSTFTRNLQRQIDRELDRLYPEPKVKFEKAVLRKGRENYACLLNYEEAVGRAALMPAERVALGLMARWLLASRDGDMQGGDFPAWLPGVMGAGRVFELTDRRGECIYSACPHYRRCFIERSSRMARRADLVIANHALVMVQAAQGALEEADERPLPLRYVFDEGHHLFQAADSAFAAKLTGAEAYELRRWLLGPEGPRARGGRAKGLANRVGDLVAEQKELAAALDDVLGAARALPALGWRERIANAAPRGPGEAFFAQLRAQVLARSEVVDGPYGLETEAHPPVPGLVEAAAELDHALARLARPLCALAERLSLRLDDEADRLDSATRARIEAVCRGLRRRGRDLIGSWRDMLQDLIEPSTPDATPAGATPAGAPPAGAPPAGAPEGFVDWFAVERTEGRERDVGMHRHHLDPMVPFAQFVLRRAHGVLVTSATLKDGTGDAEQDWAAAEARTGARYLAKPAIRAEVLSPFDYPRQTRVFVVSDINRDDPDQVASAYRELFLASGGGALGLFTAINRLRAIHGRIAEPLDAAGIALLAQHVDGLDTTTLVEILRTERNACLLGTDAVRDGVDVPGASLRLIVFDRVPWPRPDILHRARKAAFGGVAYDDMLTRLKLKQAYGRLIRRADDAGVFVMLDRMMPSRLLGAFPGDVAVERVGLARAVEGVRDFLAR